MASPTPPLIEGDRELEALAARLRQERRLAFDTEAASFHRYLDRIYLMQVSSAKETALIDPLAVDELAPLADLLEDRSIELVFHDADYDLRALDRDYGIHPRRLFDTRIAAQLIGEPGVGLSALLLKYFDVVLDKRWQRADWSRRPLAPDMIAYAAADTHHLLRLRDTLEGRLRELGRHSWAEEEFTLLESVRWTQPADQDAFLALRGAKALRPRHLAVLRQLYQWRDDVARAQDVAPFRVLGNDALVALATSLPTDAGGLATVGALPATLARRHAEPLLAAIHAGLSIPEADWPRVERGRRPRPDPALETTIDRLKAYRTQRAAELGIEAGVLCPNGTLIAIARAAPATAAELKAVPDIKTWQVEALGSDRLLRELAPSATPAG